MKMDIETAYQVLKMADKMKPIIHNLDEKKSRRRFYLRLMNGQLTGDTISIFDLQLNQVVLSRFKSKGTHALYFIPGSGGILTEEVIEFIEFSDEESFLRGFENYLVESVHKS